MNIAILGAGSVGGALGKQLAAAGHRIFFGVPHPQNEKIQRLLADIGANASAGTVGEAASQANIILLATPWPAVPEALQAAGELADKILVDCTNPLQMGPNGLELTTGLSSSGAEQIAAWAPNAHVVKAFNQTGFGNMQMPVYDGKRSVMFVCGDKPEARATVCELSEAVGFETIDAGQLRVARLLEPLAMLWIHLSFTTTLKRDFAFALLHR